MPNFNRWKKYLFLSIILIFILLLIFGIALRAFFRRPPILIVTDSSFSLLYGPERLERQLRRISYSFFRQVILVPVDESAGTQLVAIAAREAYGDPWAIIFPYRYFDAATRYRETMPETPVFVIGGLERFVLGNFSFISTDSNIDYYRAGMAAALFTGEKRPLFFSDETLSEELRGYFMQGLSDNGYSEEPVFLNASSDYSSWSEIGCVVLSGPAAAFAEQNMDIPVILFSWIDPSLTPGTVKIVFDDSPLTLAVEALKSPPEGVSFIPSTPLILRDRIGEKGIYTKLKDIMRKN
jgi:hypothetical protein